MEDFDYIIVGAGSAGCVMANRLSQDASTRILLIEAGGEDRNPYIPIPMGIGKTLANPQLTSYYATEPDAGSAFRPRIWMEERAPGSAVQSDEEIIEASRQDDACMHAVRTCRMGIDDAAVVDPWLRVRGASGLRVVDCSVMPTQVSGNTNGPVMALAWRAAELIRASNAASLDATSRVPAN